MTHAWTHTSSNAKAFERSEQEWYVEPPWCSERLFAEETFIGGVYDPCCGIGRVVLSALGAGLNAYGSDLVFRGWDSTPQNFFDHQTRHDNVCTNPPFNIAVDVTQHALKLARSKVAIIFPTARLNAARWLQGTPLHRIWLLTPRPSMPPGHVILANEKPTGGKSDFCWLVFDQSFVGLPEVRWLHRDGVQV